MDTNARPPATLAFPRPLRVWANLVGRWRHSAPQRLGLALVLPSLVIIFGLLFYPLAYSLVISVYDLHVTTPWLGQQFVGLGNYIQVVTTPGVQQAVGRTLYLALIGIGMGLPLAICFALILNQKFPLRGLVRGLLIVPWVIP